MPMNINYHSTYKFENPDNPLSYNNNIKDISQKSNNYFSQEITNILKHLNPITTENLERNECKASYIFAPSHNSDFQYCTKYFKPMSNLCNKIHNSKNTKTMPYRCQEDSTKENS